MPIRTLTNPTYLIECYVVYLFNNQTGGNMKEKEIWPWIVIVVTVGWLTAWLIFEVNVHGGQQIEQVKVITGWITEVHLPLITLSEVKPAEKYQFSSRFGPMNLPPGGLVHDLIVETETISLKVGDRVQVKVLCTSRQAIPVFYQERCKIQSLQLLR